MDPQESLICQTIYTFYFSQTRIYWFHSREDRSPNSAAMTVSSLDAIRSDGASVLFAGLLSLRRNERTMCDDPTLTITRKFARIVGFLDDHFGIIKGQSVDRQFYGPWTMPPRPPGCRSTPVKVNNGEGLGGWQIAALRRHRGLSNSHDETYRFLENPSRYADITRGTGLLVRDLSRVSPPWLMNQRSRKI